MRGSGDRRRSGWARAGAALALALWARAAGALPSTAPEAAPPPIEAGTSLTTALLELERQGLAVLFSSRLVPPELVVAAPPVATEPRARLDELLAPHGLIAVAGPGGSWIVAALDAAPPAGSLGGRVRSRASRSPVAGVAIRLLEPGAAAGLAATSDAEGRFELDGVPAGLWRLELSHPGFVVETTPAVAARPGERTELALELQPAPFAGEEIVVHPSRASVLAAETASLVALDRDEIEALPHLGGDILRALEFFPGVASNDLTAQFHVRGGRRDEVRIELDGQELYDAFHLQDFDSALSLVAASTLAGVHLTTGAFPARWGDRMGGVLELATAPPEAGRSWRLAASFLALEAAAAGRSAGGAASWLVLGRQGTARLADQIVERDQPEYHDLFGRLEWSASERQTLRLHALVGGDRLDLVEGGDEPKRIGTAYDSAYLWLTHQLLLGDRAYVDSALGASRLDRDRSADERDDEKAIVVDDRRESRIVELQQTWHLQPDPSLLLEIGGAARRFTTDYDYFSLRNFETPLAELRAEPREGEWSFRGRLEDEPYGLFALGRWQPTEALALEAGLRYDDHSLVDDRVWSPRAQLAWARGDGVVRLAWGHYHQSQRAYELAVVDGESEVHPLERAEHRVVGYERWLASGPLAGARLELYRRSVRDPRPRYESLLEPFDAFPEGEVDRYRFAPESSVARGAELFLRFRETRRLGGWLAYAWAESEDEIEGETVARLIDQTHTLNASCRLALPREWTLDLVWVFHTGRPTTAVGVIAVPDDDGDDDGGGDGDGGGEDDDGEGPAAVVDAVTYHPVLGPLNAERLADYHRLDLRLSREWQLARGRLTFWLDGQNLYDRENAAGYSIELDEETGELLRDPELWPGFFASAGVSWEF